MSDEIRRLKAALRDSEAARVQAEVKLARWHEAMTDVSVINWTLSEENAEDLHKQLIAVIAQTVQEVADPKVSEMRTERDAAITARDEALALLKTAGPNYDDVPETGYIEWWRKKRALLARYTEEGTGKEEGA